MLPFFLFLSFIFLTVNESVIQLILQMLTIIDISSIFKSIFFEEVFTLDFAEKVAVRYFCSYLFGD